MALPVPAELWQHALGFLPSEDLVPASRVSRTFAELVSRILLLQADCADLQRDELSLPPRAVCGLAIHTPVSTLPASSLAVTVGDRGEIVRQIRAVRWLVGIAPNLHRLSIEFTYDPFLVPQETRRKILDDTCYMLSALATRAGGPVVVVVAGQILNCRAEDILRWRLDISEYHNPRTWLGWSLHEGRPYDYLGYRDVAWKALPRIRSLHSVSLQLVPGPSPFSLIVLNAADIGRLHLGGNHSALQPSLAAIIQHLRLPELRSIRIYSENIPPSILSSFLSAHKKLQILDYHPNPRDRWMKLASPLASRSLLEPAGIAHPELRSIYLGGYWLNSDYGHILPALALSPKLILVSIVYGTGMRGARAHELIADLRGLASRPADLGLTLGFNEYSPWAWDIHGQYARLREKYPRAFGDGVEPAFWTTSPAALEVASLLTCVKAAWGAVRSYAGARELLPWLGRIPASSLRRLGFSSILKDVGIEKLQLAEDGQWVFQRKRKRAKFAGRKRASEQEPLDLHTETMRFIREVGQRLPQLVHSRIVERQGIAFHYFW
ncbi:hypothetical protein MKEN_00965500 [Mycena kentingensis (nom. inval.)]|nr:hypothetical protein MKEN_00965500 [Mycena kentingensis (nom. inval.)]